MPDATKRVPSWGGLAMVGIGGALLLALARFNARRSRAAERCHPAKGRFIELDGTRLHYVDRGQGSAIVLLHGNGATVEDFEASGLVERLAARHRVIAFDRPGLGHSPRPRGRLFTARRQARLIAHALEQLVSERAVIVGHSWGTLVALNLALDHPGRVGALVLLNGFYYPIPRADLVLALPSAIPILGDILNHTIAPALLKRASRRLLAKIFAPSAVPLHFSAGSPLDLALRPGQLRAMARDTIQLLPAAAALSRRYRTLTQPVFVLAAAEDAIVNAAQQSHRLARELRSPIQLLSGGHMAHYDAPEEIVAAIERAASSATTV